jgi:hypothetical protein
LPEPKPTDVLKQITAAWEQAKGQLADLRAAVERTGELAKAQQQSTYFGKDRDQALRDLGAAVWGQVRAGKLQLPSSLGPAVKAIQAVEARVEAHNREINDLILEGGEQIDRLKAKTTQKSHKTAVAPRSKKR